MHRQRYNPVLPTDPKDKMEISAIEFSKIYDNFYEKILRYLSKLVGRDEAEDLCQEVFIKIDKSLGDFRKESKLSTWIYRIATNSALDFLKSRSHKLHKAANSIEENKEVLQKQLATKQCHSPADQQLIRDEMSDCVKGYVDELPQDYRIVLLLSVVEEFKNQEIADVLGISLDNVKVRLHRAKAKLRDSLTKNCDFYRNEQNVLACDKKQVPSINMAKLKGE